MSASRGWVYVIVCTSVVACVDAKTSSSDTSRPSMRQDSATRVDMIQLDSMAASPAQNAPSTAVPAVPVIGESRRDASPTARQPENRDPMPPLAGETNMRSGAMKPAEPVLRDSASGPRLRIDSTGKVKPIKR
jgi:hypothetical protein